MPASALAAAAAVIGQRDAPITARGEVIRMGLRITRKTIDSIGVVDYSFNRWGNNAESKDILIVLNHNTKSKKTRRCKGKNHVSAEKKNTSTST